MLITVKEACELLSINDDTLRRREKAGILKPVEGPTEAKPNQKKLYDLDDVLRQCPCATHFRIISHPKTWRLPTNLPTWIVSSTDGDDLPSDDYFKPVEVKGYPGHIVHQHETQVSILTTPSMSINRCDVDRIYVEQMSMRSSQPKWEDRRIFVAVNLNSAKPDPDMIYRPAPHITQTEVTA